MRTIRKRAIERARHLTRMGTIEVGDTVEVVSLVYTDDFFGVTKEMNRVGDTFVVGESVTNTETMKSLITTSLVLISSKRFETNQKGEQLT